MKNTRQLTGKNPDPHQGFSLVEMMIVISLIAILAVFAGPELTEYRKNVRLRNSAREIYTNIQKAKTEAAKRNQCAGVVLTTAAYPTEGGTYTTFVDNGQDKDGNAAGTPCDGVRDPNEDSLPITVVNVESGVSLYKADNIGGVSAVIAQPTGLIRNSQKGNIELRTDNRWYRITVSPAGGLQLQISHDGTTWSN